MRPLQSERSNNLSKLTQLISRAKIQSRLTVSGVGGLTHCRLPKLLAWGPRCHEALPSHPAPATTWMTLKQIPNR